MLYEHDDVELPRLYDPDTGKDELSELQGKDGYTQAIEDGEIMASLQKHAGWKMIQAWLQTATIQYSEALLYEQDLEKMRRLQEAVKCYRSVSTFAEYKIQEADFAQKQLAAFNDSLKRDKPARGNISF
jgi:hypothetical protein